MSGFGITMTTRRLWVQKWRGAYAVCTNNGHLVKVFDTRARAEAWLEWIRNQ